MGNNIVTPKDSFQTLDEFAFRQCMIEVTSLKVASRMEAVQKLEDALNLKMRHRFCPRLLFRECVRNISEAHLELNLKPIVAIEENVQNMQKWHILQSSLELSSNARKQLDVLESKRRKISLWVLYAEILSEGPISSRSETKPVSRYALSMRYPAVDF